MPEGDGLKSSKVRATGVARHLMAIVAPGGQFLRSSTGMPTHPNIAPPGQPQTASDKDSSHPWTARQKESADDAAS